MLLGERQLRDVREPAGRRGGGEPRRRQLLAVEGRALEEVGELGAVARVVDGELLGPGAGLDLGREHQSGPVLRPALVLDRLLGPPRHQEAERLLLLLGQVGEQAGRAREDRNGLHGGGREAEVEHHRRDRHRDVHRQRLAPGLGDGVAEAAREQDVRPAHAAGVGELEDPLGARVERPVDRMAEARHPAAGRVDRARRSRAATAAGVAAGRHLLLRLLEQPRARLGRAEDDRAAAEDPRRDGALQRSGVGRERHARGDVGGHHPVLGDRDEQQVEEEALVLGRLAPGEQQVEVLGEAQPAHQVAGRGRGRAPRPGRDRPG